MRKWPAFCIVVFSAALFWAGAALANGTLTATFIYPYSFGSPASIAVDSSGVAYIADAQNNRIVRFIPSSKTWIGSWGAEGTGNGAFNNPRSVAVYGSGSSEAVYVADEGNRRIEEFTASGGFVRQWSSWTANGATESFNYPDGIAVSPSTGNVYVADFGNNLIDEFTASGSYVTQWADTEPLDVAVDPSSGNVYVSNRYVNAGIIEEFTADGTYVTQWGVNAFPFGIAVDPSSGNVYITQENNSTINEVQEFSPGGGLLNQWGGFSYPEGVAVDPSGNVDVADSTRVVEFNPSNASGTWTVLGAPGSYEPLNDAWVYLQNPANQIMMKYFRPAEDILGPSDSSGIINASVPDGTYRVMILRRAPLTSTPAAGLQYDPPDTGDYAYIYPGTITVNDGSTVNLGAIDAKPFVPAGSITVTGTVLISSMWTGTTWVSNVPAANAFVFASPVNCAGYGGDRTHGGENCPGAEMLPAQAPADSSGHFTINLRDPGTYYIYYGNDYPAYRALTGYVGREGKQGGGPQLLTTVTVGAGQTVNIGSFDVSN